MKYVNELVMTRPYTVRELEAEMDEKCFVTGYVAVPLNDMINAGLIEFLDLLSVKLTGSECHNVMLTTGPSTWYPTGSSWLRLLIRLRHLMTRLATLPDATVSLNIGLCEPGIRLAHHGKISPNPFSTAIIHIIRIIQKPEHGR